MDGLWHDDHGSGTTAIVLLHAFPLSSVMYDGLVPHLDGTRTIRVDLPGLGRSPVPGGPPSVAAMADAVREVVDGAGVDRVVLVGTSTGGYVALEYLARHPDDVAGLALLSTTTRVIAPDVPDERRELAARLERTRATGDLVDDAVGALSASVRERRPELADLLAAVVDAADPLGVAWVARAIADRRDTSDVLAAFPGRVLLLFGAADDETPPARAREMAALRPDRPTDVVVLPRTGHLTALERPLQVAAELLALSR